MSSNEQKEALKIISELLEDPYNQICADCQCQPSKWASTTLGVFICIDCSGVHRSLGTHISFVRSCTLDSWALDQARLMRAIGNRLGNLYWEAKLPKDYQRPGNSNRSLMQAFIKEKYQIKRWADAGPPPHIVFKHLLSKQLLSQTVNNSKRSKNSRHSGSHKHGSRTSRRSEKAQNSVPPQEEQQKPATTTQVVPATDDLNIPLDDFFAEQPRRTIPKPYIPHKKVVYEVPKEEPDYENMNSDEIDKFFQNDSNKADGYDQINSENAPNNSLEKAMMQRIQIILDEENPRKSIKMRGQNDYDDNYEDEEEDDDIFGDSAVAVTIPFGQHASRSDPQISNTAENYDAFGDADSSTNTYSLQSFFDKTPNAKIANTSNSDKPEVRNYANLSIDAPKKNPANDSDSDENVRRQQASKAKRSVVLGKKPSKDAAQLLPESKEKESAESINNENEDESKKKDDELSNPIDTISLDISGAQFADLNGTGNNEGGFWDDDAADANNGAEDGFFELPANHPKLNEIPLEGKALQKPSNPIEKVSHNDDGYEYKNVEDGNLFMEFGGKNDIMDYNPFAADGNGNSADNQLESFLNAQENREDSQPNQSQIRAENEDDDIVDLNEIAAEIEEEEEKESPNAPPTADETNAAKDENHEEEEKEGEVQEEESESEKANTQEENRQENKEEVQQENKEENKEEVQQEQKEENKEEVQKENKDDENQQEQPECKEEVQNEHPEYNQEKIEDNDKVEYKNSSQSASPAYPSRPSKLTISMVSAMDLKPPGFTQEDEMIDDFFAEAEAAIVKPSPQPQRASHSSRHAHSRRQNDYDYDYDYDAFGNESADSGSAQKSSANDGERRHRRKREAGSAKQPQVPIDVAVSRAQKSSFAPPPVRKPGAHIPARLQKKMEPPPAEKESRRKRHHHSKK